MKKIITFLYVILCVTFSVFGQENLLHFADHPTLTPDGETVIFSYNGDLWQAKTTENAKAHRLTAMDGTENNPSISPDGKWLAFNSTQYGNNDVYIMPMAGGEIKQLTYHQANDVVMSWSWDNQHIYFSSNRYNRLTSFKIKATGGTPKQLFGHYHNLMHNVAESPTDGALYFNETWESSSFTHRKRYKGAYNPDIKSYNPKTKAYQTHTTYEGKDMWASIDKTGKIYFASDESNGEYNLYTLENGKKKRLTNFKTSLFHPVVSATGNAVVFRKDYQLWLYDTKNQKPRPLNIQAIESTTLSKSQDFNVKGKISAFDVASDGKKMAFVSRGELFVSDIKGKFVQQIKTKSDGRVLEVYWMKDSKTLIFNQTVQGYQNWFTIAANGKEKEKQITEDAQNNRLMALNPDQTKAVYFSGRNEVRLMDLETMKSEVIAKGELWGFQNDQPYFSPDGEYIVYNAYKNFEKDIFIHHIASKKTTNLTKTGVTENQPYWSPDGKYLYFVTNRTQPVYPYGLRDAKIYRMPLQQLNPPFRSDKFDELFAEKEKKEEKDKKETDKSKKEAKSTIKVTIDFENAMQRIQQIGPRFGAQNAPTVLYKGGKTTLLFTSNHDEGKSNLWKMTMEDFEKTETKKIVGASTRSINLASAKGKHYLLFGGNIHELNLSGNKTKKIDISYKFRRTLKEEFNQMFYETWANMEENFYSEDFHGIDWLKTRKQYETYLANVNSRADLRQILNDMLGELNTSHFGFYSNGKEEQIYHKTTTLATGIDFDTENPYKVNRIIKKSPVDKSDISINIGDVLVAVNGEQIHESQNRESYFVRPSMDNELSLTFKGSTGEYTVKIHPTYYFSTRTNRYDEWMADCQKRVDEKSNNKIAYVHMKNMGGGQLAHFKEEMVSEGYQKEALILDLRYNTGGNVHDEVLRFLSQRPYLQWKYREGALTQQSNFSPAAKPIVLLINEQSLSDAEMTTAGFKALKLGTVIGTETYRWIIFTSGKGLVDGSFYRLPSWGCYTLDGKNLEKTGVAPDIFVKNTFKDRAEGNDPQLDRAIEEVLKMLNTKD